MKTTKRIILLAMSALLLLSNFSLIVQARSLENNIIEERERCIVVNLLNSGFTQEEIDYLLKSYPIDEYWDTNSNQINNNLNDNLERDNQVQVNAKPKVGDTKRRTVYISTKSIKSMGVSYKIVSGSIVLSKTAAASVIIKKIGWVALVGSIAAEIAGVYLPENGGLKLNITDTYQYADNAMTYRWIPTVTRWSIYGK